MISLHFTRKSGESYTVVGTKSTGYKATDAIDTIKSHRTGKYKEMTRLETIKFQNS